MAEARFPYLYWLNRPGLLGVPRDVVAARLTPRSRRWTLAEAQAAVAATPDPESPTQYEREMRVYFLEEPGAGAVPAYNRERRRWEPSRPVPSVALDVFGHSIAAGGGVTDADRGGYARRLQRLLGARRLRNYAIGGAVACWSRGGSTGDGGWPWALAQSPPRTPNVEWLGGGVYAPHRQLVVLHYDLNDMARLGREFPEAWRNAMRVMMSRACAAAIYPSGSAQFARAGGGWLEGTNQHFQTDDGTFHYTPTIGASVTFSTEADYPGGLPVAIGLVVPSSYGPFTIGVQVNGVDRPDVSIVPAQVTDSPNGKTNAHVLRFGTGAAGDAALPAGVNTVKLTLEAASGGANLIVDYAQVEAAPADGPVLVLPTKLYPFSYSIYNGQRHGPGTADPISDSMVDFYDAMKLELAAEFGARCVLPDLSSCAGDECFHSDGIHPNARGHALIANAINDAVRQSGLLTADRAARAYVDDRQAWCEVGVYPNASFQNSWSQYGALEPPFSYRKDDEGRVWLRGAVKGGSAANAVIATLPGAFRPATQIDVPISVWTGAVWQAAFARVNTDGTVSVMQGGATGAGVAIVFPTISWVPEYVP